MRNNMIRLFTPWYKDDCHQRQLELDWCLKKNCGDFNIIANTDIYFDDTITNIKLINMENICIVLTRYEANPKNKGSKSEMAMNPAQSNDVWIFKGIINKEIKCDFNLGLLGCEGIFGNSLRNAGYKVYNFSNDI